MLGTQGVGNVLLHERQDGWVRAYPKRRSLGQFDYVQRNAGVLVVEGHDVQKDLLPLIPDDVNSLILRLGQGAVTCHLSKATWRRLETVIVDCRHALEAAPTVPGKLIWDFDEPQKLLFEIVEQHLIIVDADSEHCLIFRDVCSADPALRGEVFLAFEKHRSHPVSTLVAQVKAKTARSGGVSLQALSPQTATVD
jgi:insecticidal toxin